MKLWQAIAGLLLGCAGVWTANAAAEEFRIASRVLVGPVEEAELVSENVTLFRNDLVYDFLAQPEQICVFKKSLSAPGGRFILLDKAHQLRTEISTEQLLKFNTGLKAWSAAQEDPLLKFCGDPKFVEEASSDRSELKLTSDVISYRLACEPAVSAEASRQYRDFSDWYARLGAMLHPGTTPPFARLEVNASLSRMQAVPRGVHLSIPAHKPHRKEALEVHSEHQINWRLSKQDLDRIDQANQHLVEFKLVELAEYRAATK